MDEIDVAQREAERFLERAVAGAKRAVGPAFTGHCHYCDEVVAAPRRFCDFDCASDYEKEQKQLRLNGNGHVDEDEESDSD